MSIDIYKALDEIVLEEQYTEDVSKKCVVYFNELGISLDELIGWKKLYPIVYPWDKNYNSLRLNYNRIGQFFPKFIMMAKKKCHIQWAIKIALKYKIKFTIRSGGHCSVNSSLCNGIVIDLSNRNYIKVKDDIVKIGSGTKFGFLIEELNKYNKFFPTGSCQSVCPAGFIQAGGIGYLRRKYGLGIDNLLSITMIIADGSIIKVDKDNYSDLFWGIRGSAGGSLGLITDLTLRTYKLNKIALFKLWINFKHFNKVFDIWQKWNFEAPHDLTSWIQFYPPHDNKYPEQIMISGQYYGRKKELLKLLCIFDDFISSKSLEYDTFVEAACKCCSHPNYFYKYLTLFAPNYLSYEAINGLRKIMKHAPPNSTVEIDGMGGQITKVNPIETAFPYRNAKCWIICKCCSDSQEDIPMMEKWTRSTHDFLVKNGVCDEKTGLPCNYVNFKDLELSLKDYPYSYWQCNVKKLVKIKQKYDPDNVFHFSQSVPLKLSNY